MITFLRLAGLGTAAIWLGGTVFFVLGIDPVLGGVDLLRLLGPLHTNEVSFVASQRFHLFQVTCASLALVQALGEWLYTGRPFDRRLLFLLLTLLALGSTGRLYVVPKCRAYNAQAHLGPARQILRQPLTPPQRQAAQALNVWLGVGVVFNVISLAGVAVYLLQQASPNNAGPRLFPKARLRI